MHHKLWTRTEHRDSALSEDRPFPTAYDAALQTAKMAITCTGYRRAIQLLLVNRHNQHSNRKIFENSLSLRLAPECDAARGHRRSGGPDPAEGYATNDLHTHVPD